MSKARYEGCDNCKHHFKLENEFPCVKCKHNYPDMYEPATKWPDEYEMPHLTEDDVRKLLALLKLFKEFLIE